MTEQPTSYLAKLTADDSTNQEPVPWHEEEEETHVEPGDIIVGCVDNIPSLDLSPSFQKRLEQRWEKAVIVKLLGRNISYRVLLAKIKSLWQPKGLFKVIDLENNFFVVKFEKQSDYLHSSVGGPWSVFNSALCIFPWSLDFCARTGSVDKAVV
ncbi:hypothetical protein Tsubulata_027037 [Turnera subulata]|uniref:DUF4283 domain-containing protein n=1 Tax=Turnera subulata TaxID=218843 RepID=A0A9Q0GLI8_9ROSI|nr:hypothetical protein Tsubulata_027037 [Turnera subulata]